MQPPDYTFDTDRLAALASYAILDTPADPGFDGIVQLATQLCETPVALVSLVAEDRQWFKARVGFEPSQTDLNSSVCSHALIEPNLLIIPDLTQDERTRDNPLVTGNPHIRFYAGAPFRAGSGEAIGSLCVIDTKRRPAGLTPMQAEGLRLLANQVTILLELRRALVERDALTAEQRDAESRRTALLSLGDSLREISTPAEMIRVAASIVGQTLNASRAGFSQLDDKGDYLPGEPDWAADGQTSPGERRRINDHVDLWEGLLRGEPLIIKDVGSDPRTSAKAAVLLDLGMRSLVNIPVREHGRTVAVFVVHDREPRDWPPEVIAFLRNVAERLEFGIARLKSDAEQQVLNRELSHRLKNTFAMVQAIATQTLRAVPDQAPVSAFIQRIHALSTAHDILLKRSWTTTRMGDIAIGVIAVVAELSRFDFSGPDLEIGPRVSLSLSLLLHELTTNAVKYGSLSREGGRVAVTWGLSRSESEPEVMLGWCEMGGPPVQEPNRKGFGSRLMRMGLLGTGGVDLRYLPTGFTAEFRAPMAQVQLA